MKRSERIKIEPRKTLNNPDREIDVVIRFPIHHKSDVGQEAGPERAEHIESRHRRLDIVKGLHAAGLELTESMTQDGSSYLFRVSAPMPLLRRIAEQMGARFKTKLLSTQEETQKGLWPGFAPYVDENKNKYDICLTGKFKPIDRQQIIRYIIERALGGDGFHDRVIEQLDAEGVCSVYPTHSDEDREDLITMWACFGRKMLVTWQPLDKIRDYFGEEIAIYFAFLGFYTFALVPLAVIGVATYYFQSQNAHHDTAHSFGYAGFCCCWAAVFISFWRREQNQLQVKWDVQDFEEEQEDRLEFTGEVKLSTITMEPEIVFEDRERLLRYAVTGLILFTCVVLVVGAALAVIMLKNKLLDLMGAPGSTIGGVISAVSVLILNLIYIEVAHAMNDYENHQTRTRYEDMLIVKLFLFQFVNTFFAIFFMAFLATRVELMGEEIKCHLSCLEEVQSLTQSLLVTNLLVGNVTETLVPYIQFKLHQEALKHENADVQVYHSKHEIEGALPEFEGSFEEYNEIVLQFSIVTVCALAYPLGGLIALVNNLIEIRSDAFKLVRATQRPFYRCAQDIGSWQSILEITISLAIVSNCAMAGYTSKVFDNEGWVTSDRAGDLKKLILLFAAEHVLFFLCFLCSALISECPVWLNSAALRLEHRKQDVISTQELREEAHSLEANNRELFSLFDEDDVVRCEDVWVQKWRVQPQYGVKHLAGVSPPSQPVEDKYRPSSVHEGDLIETISVTNCNR